LQGQRVCFYIFCEQCILATKCVYSHEGLITLVFTHYWSNSMRVLCPTFIPKHLLYLLRFNNNFSDAFEIRKGQLVSIFKYTRFILMILFLLIWYVCLFILFNAVFNTRSNHGGGWTYSHVAWVAKQTTI